MPDEPWEQATRPRRGRWPLVAGLAVALVAAALLARPDGEGAPPDTLEVESPPSTASPAPLPEAAGEWVEVGSAPISTVPSVHVGVWTGTELVVGFHHEVAAYDPAGGTWRKLPDMSDQERLAPRVVWTGEEIMLFGGSTWDGPEPARADGLRLDPDAGRWRPVPPAPSAPLFEPLAVWTGAEVVVWGGARPGDAHELGTWPVRGSAYDPVTNRWRVIAKAPVGHVYFSDGLWTGREVVVWGGHHPPGVELPTAAGVPFAAAYDPAADAWRRLPAPPLEDPAQAAAVWTGREVLLWGRSPGAAGEVAALTGAALDPRSGAGAWRALPAVDTGDEAAGTYRLAAAWTGRAAILAGGYPRSTGLVHTPHSGAWQRLPAHPARVHAVAAWTGSEFLLWGGYTTGGPDVDLWAFRPAGIESGACPPPGTAPGGDRLPGGWSRSGAPLPGTDPAALAWTGTHVLAWGGSTVDRGARLEGAIVDLPTLARRCLPAGPLRQRIVAGATWTPWGLFVWGGLPPTAEGALYDPSTATWRVLPDAPLEEGLPDAVTWTGTEVLVWGAAGDRRGPLGGGAAYNPATDTWRPLPDAPVGLTQVDTAWTGEELVVLGGRLGRGNVATTRHAVGMAYAPGTDAWRRLPDHPLSPQASSVAWTGEVLVAWDYLLDAAAYDPVTDAWTPLPPLPLGQSECYPSSAVAGGRVFASYCGQAALLDPRTMTWQAVAVPSDLPGSAPVSAGDEVLFADHAALWRYRPPR